MNNFITAKVSLDMTRQELINMDVPVDDLGGDNINESIKTAATDYAQTQIKNIPEINKYKSEIATIEDHVETPLDYNKSLLKTDLPIRYRVFIDLCHLNQFF